MNRGDRVHVRLHPDKPLERGEWYVYQAFPDRLVVARKGGSARTLPRSQVYAHNIQEPAMQAL